VGIHTICTVCTTVILIMEKHFLHALYSGYTAMTCFSEPQLWKQHVAHDDKCGVNMEGLNYIVPFLFYNPLTQRKVENIALI